MSTPNMTTTITIKNSAYSNGDVAFTRRQPTHNERKMIAPGEDLTVSVSGSDDIELTEFWPQRSPPAADHQKNGQFVDEVIAREVAVQIKMWGPDRDDGKQNELLGAALASAVAVHNSRVFPETAAFPREKTFSDAKALYYPKNWSPDAFRDYGSDFANLAVAAAFIRNAMLLMVANGEDTRRSKREGGYAAATPMMSAQEAGSR